MKNTILNLKLSYLSEYNITYNKESPLLTRDHHYKCFIFYFHKSNPWNYIEKIKKNKLDRNLCPENSDVVSQNF